jgi:hypothetical protein
MELKALGKIGVHPNVVRLLEDYQGYGGENVLVYEYCDGLTLWELFKQDIKDARSKNKVLIGRLLQQLLMALEHINACGVEHRDLKPENIFLNRVSVPEQQVELKLGDFGWAGIGVTTELPPQGAGSLWYAPPELNPPVDLACDSTAPSTPNAMSPGSQATVDVHKEGVASPLRRSPDVGKDVLQEMQAELAKSTPQELRPFGKADMWSTGVVLYLLLVGHNPFHAALSKEKPKAIEQEVLRLVARGLLDDTCAEWLCLGDHARELICSTVQVRPQKRPSPSEALRHPFLMCLLARSGEKLTPEPAWRVANREDAWGQLDGFQRLGWVAVARALGEPEIRPEVISMTLRAVRARSARGAAGTPQSSYLLQLAREISAMPLHEWLLDRGAWDELLRLAFTYLDVDADNIICTKDLANHIATAVDDAERAAEAWIERWESDAGGLMRASSRRGLTVASLRTALLEPFGAGSEPAEDGLLHIACDGIGHTAGFFDMVRSRHCEAGGKL